MKLPEESIRSRLDDWPVARLATVDAGGAPHQVPIVFARVGEALWSPVDGKAKSARELARVRHVRDHPRVCLLLDDYTDDWSMLWWIRIDARGRVVQDDEEPDLPLAVSALRAKYSQYGRVAVLRDPPTLLAFEPLRVQSWCADS